jgi:glycosyltransferase involved in cell wall biosynthesis
MGPVSTKASHGAASITLYPFHNKILRCFYPFWVLWMIYQIKKKYRIEFLYATFEPLNIIISSLAKILCRIKWIEDLWDDPEKSILVRRNLPGFGSPFILYIKFVEFLIAKKLLKYADKFIIAVVAEPMYKKYAIQKESTLSITNGINLDYNFNMRVKKKDDVVTLFYCGTVDQIRLEGLLPCLSEVVKELSPIRIIIVGYELNGGYKWIQHELKILGEDVLLDLRGTQPYNRVIEATLESDICICPYPNRIDIASTYPVKIFDYMAAGKPVVASSLSGIRKIITNGYNGLLFAPGDYVEMSKLIIKLCESFELRNKLAKNAKASVKEFSWNRIHEEILLYLEDN